MKYASLETIDDKDETLAKVGISNPCQIEALKFMLGSEEEVHKPLSFMLSNHTRLELDKRIDVSGFTPAGNVLDAQGCIAHNHTTIVLAYRFTTLFKD